MINSYLFGQSRVYGLSFLNYSSLVSIQETYTLGSTSFVFDRGNFYINTYTKPSPFKQASSIYASSSYKTSKQFRSLSNREFVSGFRFTDLFGILPPQNIDVEFSDNGYFTSSEQFYGANGAIGNMWLSSHGEIDDAYLSVRYSDTGGTLYYGSYGLLLRSKTPSSDSTDDAYIVGVNKAGATSKFIIGQVIQGGLTILSSTGLSIRSSNSEDYIYYDLLAYIKGNKLYGSISGSSIGSNGWNDIYPGVTYNTSLSYTIPTYNKGYFGIYGNATGTSGRFLLNPRLFSMATLNKPVTYQEVIEKANYSSDSWDVVSYDMGLTFYSDDHNPTVGSWSQGTSGGMYFANWDIVSGSSLNWATNFTNVASEYVYEVEVKGSSGTRAGLYIGSSAYMYAFTPIFGSSSNQSLTYKTGTNYVVYQNSNPFIYLNPERWYKMTACRFGKEIAFYVEGQLGNYLSIDDNGASLASSGVDSGNGLVAKQTGVSGGVVQFRNPRVQILSTESGNVSIPSGTNYGSLVERFLPANFYEIAGASNIKISFLGASRATLGVTDGYHLFENTTKVENTVQSSFTKGDRVMDVTRVGISEMSRVKVRWGSIINNYDSNLKNFHDVDTVSDSSIVAESLSLEGINIVTPPIPHLQINDTVRIVDRDSGVSLFGSVSETEVSMDFRSGDLTQRTTINLSTKALS